MTENTDDRLRLLIERIERLEEEKKGISDDIKDVYSEAGSVGYDKKILRQVIKLRKMRKAYSRTLPLLLLISAINNLLPTPLFTRSWRDKTPFLYLASSAEFRSSLCDVADSPLI